MKCIVSGSICRNLCQLIFKCTFRIPSCKGITFLRGVFQRDLIISFFIRSRIARSIGSAIQFIGNRISLRFCRWVWLIRLFRFFRLIVGKGFDPEISCRHCLEFSTGQIETLLVILTDASLPGIYNIGSRRIWRLTPPVFHVYGILIGCHHNCIGTSRLQRHCLFQRDRIIARISRCPRSRCCILLRSAVRI